MIPIRCQNCAKQYFCKYASKEVSKCKEFLSWIYTKNYGEVKRIEDTKGTKDNS